MVERWTSALTLASVWNAPTLSSLADPDTLVQRLYVFSHIKPFGLLAKPVIDQFPGKSFPRSRSLRHRL